MLRPWLRMAALAAVAAAAAADAADDWAAGVTSQLGMGSLAGGFEPFRSQVRADHCHMVRCCCPSALLRAAYCTVPLGGLAAAPSVVTVVASGMHTGQVRRMARRGRPGGSDIQAPAGHATGGDRGRGDAGLGEGPVPQLEPDLKSDHRARCAGPAEVLTGRAHGSWPPAAGDLPAVRLHAG